MKQEYYFDWASTAPMSPAARKAYMECAVHNYGNPSSLHRFGRRASAQLEEIRGAFADMLGIEAKTLVFTGGGTQANSIVCEHVLRKLHPVHIIISGIEHPSVYEYMTAFREAGHRISVIPAPDGIVDTAALEREISADTALVAVMSVNNVLGTIEPIEEIRRIIDTHNPKIHLHTDAVQAFGKIDSSLYVPFVDSFSASAHKIAGPKGTGLLYTRRPLTSSSLGGGQEYGLRPGTQDLPGIAAFGAAAAACHEDLAGSRERVQSLQRRLIDRIAEQSPLIRPLGSKHTSGYITAFSVSGIPAEVFVRVMNDQGFAISTGSACSSKQRAKIERVLRSAGCDEASCASAVRISTGPHCTPESIDLLADTMVQQAQLLQAALGKRKARK